MTSLSRDLTVILTPPYDNDTVASPVTVSEGAYNLLGALDLGHKTSTGEWGMVVGWEVVNTETSRKCHLHTREVSYVYDECPINDFGYIEVVDKIVKV